MFCQCLSKTIGLIPFCLERGKTSMTRGSREAGGLGMTGPSLVSYLH